MILVVFIDKVLHDGTTLEEPNGLSVGESVSQGGDPAIGVDFEKPRFFLRVLGDVDFGELIGEAELFEGDGDFDAIGRLGGV